MTNWERFSTDDWVWLNLIEYRTEKILRTEFRFLYALRQKLAKAATLTENSHAYVPLNNLDCPSRNEIDGIQSISLMNKRVSWGRMSAFEH